MMHLPPFSAMDSRPGDLGEVTRADVVSAARSWKGTPYLHQHREKMHGVDCVGLVIGVARELGLVPQSFDVNGYPRKPDGDKMLEVCRELMDPVPEDQTKPGHVLVLKFRHDPQHMGVLGDYLHGGWTLIHALGTLDGKGQVEEVSLAHERRAFRPMQAFALRGVR